MNFTYIIKQGTSHETIKQYSYTNIHSYNTVINAVSNNTVQGYKQCKVIPQNTLLQHTVQKWDGCS